jgi:hypothetical protein
MLFLFVLYLLPMIMLLAQSVEGGTLVHYQKALTDGLYVRVLVDTLLIAYVSLACLLLVSGLVFLSTPRADGRPPASSSCCPDQHPGAHRRMVLLRRHHQSPLLDSGLIDAPLPLPTTPRACSSA